MAQVTQRVTGGGDLAWIRRQSDIERACPDGQSVEILMNAIRHIPVKSAEPEHIAKAALWLCCDDSEHINGAVVPVDAGMSAFQVRPDEIKVIVETCNAGIVQDGLDRDGTLRKGYTAKKELQSRLKNGITGSWWRSTGFRDSHYGAKPRERHGVST